MTTNAERSVRADIKRNQARQKAALTLTPALAISLATIVVQAEKMVEAYGFSFNTRTLKQALSYPEVRAWIKTLRPLTPA